jgi:glycosyltransferase involved in cell wall biosynthesis
MSRFARNRRVFFFEEPTFEDSEPHVRSSVCHETGVLVQTPILPTGLTSAQITTLQRELLHSVLKDNRISHFVAWYYTPMAMSFTGDLDPALTVYDCMDELSAFAGAASDMRSNEEALFRTADLVFTGGASLFDSKRKQHSSVHLFPSSVDQSHFASARTIHHDPDDQAMISKPRFGYAGVIDERMDLDLLRQVSNVRPDWQFIMLGPVAKIDPGSLPQAPNIHWLGMKAYNDLPHYFSGWDVGILPFALNESTRFISPTKTPEYLAAGLPVVSTPIRDVVTPYSDLGLVSIAATPQEFIQAAESILQQTRKADWLERVDHFLAKSSWDKTWMEMERLIESKVSVDSNPIAIESVL